MTAGKCSTPPYRGGDGRTGGWAGYFVSSSLMNAGAANANGKSGDLSCASADGTHSIRTRAKEGSVVFISLLLLRDDDGGGTGRTPYGRAGVDGNARDLSR